MRSQQNEHIPGAPIKVDRTLDSGAGIPLEDTHGNWISSDRLKSGVNVKIIGEKTLGNLRDNTNNTIEFTKIILMTE